MEIGKVKKTVIIYPLEEPIPRRVPVHIPENEPAPQPERVPVPVPA